MYSSEGKSSERKVFEDSERQKKVFPIGVFLKFNFQFPNPSLWSCAGKRGLQASPVERCLEFPQVGFCKDELLKRYCRFENTFER